MKTNFSGKTVIVTGGATGIGLGIARAFAEAGANVAVGARSITRLNSVVADLKNKGLEAYAFPVDVGCLASVRSMFEQVNEQFGQIDVVCANAGIAVESSIEAMTEEVWDQVMNVNAKGTFFSVQAAMPYLRKSNAGRIVITSSITGPVTGIPLHAQYAASKAAQLGFMRTAALELAKDGITINAILPGTISTPALLQLGDEYISGAVANNPMRRIGEVGDIANAAMFFAAPASGFVTGQTLIVDGGQTLPEAPGAFF
jgi:3-oxoacyl-[acyl-carrier protein] reductase